MKEEANSPLSRINMHSRPGDLKITDMRFTDFMNWFENDEEAAPYRHLSWQAELAEAGVNQGDTPLI